MKFFLPLFLLVTALASSCKSKAPDVSNIPVNIEVERLDRDLFAIPAHDISWLESKYGEFFEVYTEGILGIGAPEDADFNRNLELFKNNEAVRIAEQKVKEAFPDLNDLNRRLTDAFKRYKYYFPDKNTPAVYSCISGFNQSIILTDSTIGISLEKYLGSGCEIYPMLGIAKYLAYNMKRDKITSDCVRAWAIGDWAYNYNKNNDVISKMIYEGKLIYLTKCMLPNEPDSLILGFTRNQLKWCKNNEVEMWRHLMQEKLLFATEHFTLRKLTEDAPFTSVFPSESPGKACNWIGYRIVCSYMNRFKDTKLNDLMLNDNYKAILENSRYNPK